jgi:N-acetylglucosamine-6-phosphate deacetylase
VLTATADDLRRMGRRLVATGVTSFLPTLISSPPEQMLAQLRRLAPALDDWPADAARPLGFHLEGPFLEPRRAGAHRADCLRAPDAGLLASLLDAGAGQVRLVTLAPELPGALALIDLCLARGVRVAMGHSEASYEEAAAAIARGVRLCTHLGNAGAPIHQRAPGLAVACLTAPDVDVCLIPDLVHVHPGFLALALHAKSAARIILVTDAIAAAGEPDGNYRLGDHVVSVRDGVCRDAAGNLAGSTLRFDAGLARFRQATGIGPVGEALAGAGNAARALGLDAEIGSLLPGRRADVLAWSATSGEPRLERVHLGGRLVWSRA